MLNVIQWIRAFSCEDLHHTTEDRQLERRHFGLGDTKPEPITTFSTLAYLGLYVRKLKEEKIIT